MRYTDAMSDPTRASAPLEPLDLCCGGRKCPVLHDEGDFVVIMDVEQSSEAIRIAKSDVPRVVAWFQQLAR